MSIFRGLTEEQVRDLLDLCYEEPGDNKNVAKDLREGGKLMGFWEQDRTRQFEELAPEVRENREAVRTALNNGMS
jgi:hypothetical protein